MEPIGTIRDGLIDIREGAVFGLWTGPGWRELACLGPEPWIITDAAQDD